MSVLRRIFFNCRKNVRSFFVRCRRTYVLNKNGLPLILIFGLDCSEWKILSDKISYSFCDYKLKINLQDNKMVFKLVKPSKKFSQLLRIFNSVLHHLNNL